MVVAGSSRAERAELASPPRAPRLVRVGVWVRVRVRVRVRARVGVRVRVRVRVRGRECAVPLGSSKTVPSSSRSSSEPPSMSG